jgi:hypothetical protein
MAASPISWGDIRKKRSKFLTKNAKKSQFCVGFWCFFMAKLKKQTQFSVGRDLRKVLYERILWRLYALKPAEKQSQFKANQTQFPGGLNSPRGKYTRLRGQSAAYRPPGGRSVLKMRPDCCGSSTSTFTGINKAHNWFFLRLLNMPAAVAFRPDVDVLQRTILILTRVVFPKCETEAKANTMTLSEGLICGLLRKIVRKKRPFQFRYAFCCFCQISGFGASDGGD